MDYFQCSHGCIAHVLKLCDIVIIRLNGKADEMTYEQVLELMSPFQEELSE